MFDYSITNIKIYHLIINYNLEHKTNTISTYYNKYLLEINKPFYPLFNNKL